MNKPSKPSEIEAFLNSEGLPGVTGLMSRDRFAMYGVVAAPGESNLYQLTVEVRVRNVPGQPGMRAEGPQVYLPIFFSTNSAGQRRASSLMDIINLRVVDICEGRLEQAA